MIHAQHQGIRFVAVGNELHYSNHWQTFPDFLYDYMKRVLTPAWGKRELSKPFDDRHVIMQWYDSMCLYQMKQQRRPDGLYRVAPNGAMRAYLLLAYDIYVLQHHSKLQASFIKRLKHPDQFQGARHELFAAATCIRAGYDIEHEDESDTSRKHPEFVATHSATGQKISVEAKSRHRPGVLGHPGDMQPNEVVRAGIKRLLTDALDKMISYPFVIFFDLNMPPSPGNILQAPWFEEVADAATMLDDAHGNRDLFNLIVFTNQPDHYYGDNIPTSGGEVLSVLGRKPRIVAAQPQAIAALHDAVMKFGTLPSWFDED